MALSWLRRTSVGERDLQCLDHKFFCGFRVLEPRVEAEDHVEKCDTRLLDSRRGYVGLIRSIKLRINYLKTKCRGF